MRLVEEEDQLRLVRVAHLGQHLEQLRQQPQQERRIKPGRVHQLVRRQNADPPCARGIDRHQVGQIQRRFAEQLRRRPRSPAPEAAAGWRRPIPSTPARSAPKSPRHSRPRRSAAPAGPSGPEAAAPLRPTAGRRRSARPPAARTVPAGATAEAAPSRPPWRGPDDPFRRRGPRRSPERRDTCRSSPICAAASVKAHAACGWPSPRPQARQDRPSHPTGRPARPAAENPSARICSVTVLPVPVAPAISPCRLPYFKQQAAAAQRNLRHRRPRKCCPSRLPDPSPSPLTTLG